MYIQYIYYIIYLILYEQCGRVRILVVFILFVSSEDPFIFLLLLLSCDRVCCFVRSFVYFSATAIGSVQFFHSTKSSPGNRSSKAALHAASRALSYLLTSRLRYPIMVSFFYRIDMSFLYRACLRGIDERERQRREN